MKKRPFTVTFFLVFFISNLPSIHSFELHKDHKCSGIERISKIFDASSPEKMLELQKKASEKRTADEDILHPTAFTNIEPQSFNIELTPGYGIQHYPEVSRTFLVAKSIWETLLEPTKTTENINIFIDVRRLGSGIIGSTQNVRIIGNCIQPSGVFPQPMEEKTGITFPDCSKMTFKLPQNFSWDGRMTYEKSHMKALGYSNMDYLFGKDDGQIVFSLLYLERYDFDVFDGVDVDKLDFLSVAVHEIGHLLGFTSSLDEVDFEVYGSSLVPTSTPSSFFPSILDVFRFSSSDGDYINFEDHERYATPDSTHHRFFTPPFTGVIEFSTGMFNGDGNQASHWKDDSITGKTAGVMDPTLPRGIHLPLSVVDIWAFRSIGYEVNVTTPIEVLNYEVKNINNYQKLIISAELVFSSTMFVHYFRDSAEIADYDCHFNEGGDLRWVCPYPRSDLCSFRLSNSIGKASRKASLKTDVCR